jgi:hypothetical protein
MNNNNKINRSLGSPFRGLGGLLLILFLLMAGTVMAQPLPPSSPTGNPVPVDGITALLVATLAGGAFLRLRKKK